MDTTTREDEIAVLWVVLTFYTSAPSENPRVKLTRPTMSERHYIKQIAALNC
jgi:hypothetical protein